MTEGNMWLWFNNIDGIGPAARKKLMKRFGNIYDIYEAPKKLIINLLKDSQADKFIKSKADISRYKELAERLSERNITFVYPGHKNYPEKLYNIYDPPDILYIRGNLKHSINSHNMNIGIIGSRKPSVYGMEMSVKFARELAAEGLNIISGLASGIDSKAHYGALLAGGYTVGVLGCGVNVTYPRENSELYAAIIEKGAVISEYGLDVEPLPGYFPMRNRIISGLSDGVLIVEAKKKSGSLITADYAIEQGKQVYAVPGKIFDANSEGTNNLIKEGACLVTSYKDITNDMFLRENIKEEHTDKEDDEEYTDKISLAPVEKMVYSCLSLEPAYIDEIIHAVGLDVTKTISVLYAMEEKGYIKQPVKGYYILSV